MPNSALDTIKEKSEYNLNVHFSKLLLGKVLGGGITSISPCPKYLHCVAVMIYCLTMALFCFVLFCECVCV